jgi:hypothetical protein
MKRSPNNDCIKSEIAGNSRERITLCYIDSHNFETRQGAAITIDRQFQHAILYEAIDHPTSVTCTFRASLQYRHLLLMVTRFCEHAHVEQRAFWHFRHCTQRT